MSDPIIHGFVSVTQRHGRLLAVLAMSGAALGLFTSTMRPRTFKGRTVVQCATATLTKPDQPIEDLDILATSLERSVNNLVLAEKLPKGTAIRVTPLVGPAPSPEQVNLLEMIATGPSKKDVEDMLASASSTAIEGERPLFADERARVERHVKALEEDLARVEGEKLTPENHEIAIRLFHEIQEAKRQMSPARSYEPKLIGSHPVVELSKAVEQASFAFVGFWVGLALAYAVAFALTAMRALKGGAA
jgi:hypothetical protein